MEQAESERIWIRTLKDGYIAICSNMDSLSLKSPNPKCYVSASSRDAAWPIGTPALFFVNHHLPFLVPWAWRLVWRFEVASSLILQISLWNTANTPTTDIHQCGLLEMLVWLKSHSGKQSWHLNHIWWDHDWVLCTKKCSRYFLCSFMTHTFVQWNCSITRKLNLTSCNLPLCFWSVVTCLVLCIL